MKKQLLSSAISIALCATVFSLPVSAKPTKLPPSVVESCTALSSSVFKVPQMAIKVVLRVEAGRIGTISRNDNNTYDLGPMQLNSSNLAEIKRQFPYLNWQHVTYDPCINIMVGTWWLGNRIKGRNGNVWEGIGDYHSKTPVFHNRYLALARKAYSQILAEEAYQKQISRQTISTAERPVLVSSNNN